MERLIRKIGKLEQKIEAGTITDAERNQFLILTDLAEKYLFESN